MNIVWEKPDGTLAVTSIFDGSDPIEHAKLLQLRGDVPADWVAVAFDYRGFPDAPQSCWRFVNGSVSAIAADIPVPREVTMRQARLALLQAGVLDQVDAVINFMPSPQREAARIEWDHSQTVKRDRPLVAVLAQQLGLSDSRIDELFITAATL